LIEIEMRRGEAGLYSPVGHPGAAAGKDRSDGPSHIAFWLRPVSLFGRFGVTSPASLHVRSAFHVSPGRAPPRGWQGCRRCPRSFTPWVTPQHVRVGAPKHHRVRPGCPTGTQISTLATSPTRVCSKVENVSGRAPLPPPVSSVDTFFSLPSSASGSPQNAGLSAHLTEPQGRVPEPILGHFLSLSAHFLPRNRTTPVWCGC
jgi:hypothetical protein